MVKAKDIPKAEVAVVDEVVVENCPFCGEAGLLKRGTGINSPLYWVKCSNFECGISTKAVGDDVSAAALWNRRA